MKHVIQYICLILLLTIYSCTCDKDKPNDKNKETDQDKPETKFLTMLICTANVQFFKTSTPQAVLTALDALRQEKDDIVFLGLQETESKHLEEMAKVLSAYKIYDHREASARLSNTLVVYNKTQLEIVKNGINLPAYNTKVSPSYAQRYATIVELPTMGFKVANTHLFGGRFDDRYWNLFLNARNEQIKAILNYHPTIIVGDFNADSKPRISSSYWSEKLEQYVRSKGGTYEDAIEALKTYQCSVHSGLREENYISLFKEEDIKATSSGGVVDWIYVNKKLNYSVVEKGMIEGITRGLSDHNFLWVRIKVEYH